MVRVLKDVVRRKDLGGVTLEGGRPVWRLLQLSRRERERERERLNKGVSLGGEEREA